MIAVVRNLAATVRTASPKLPSVSVPFAGKLPGPEDAVARTYDFAEQLLASQRKFAEDLLKAAAPETYKPGQVVPRDGTIECARHHDVQDHVKAGTRFAPCSHHHKHSEGCTWQYL